MSDTITLYKCDNCKKIITEPTGGLVVHGNIYVADPTERGELVGNNFPPNLNEDGVKPFLSNISALVEETVYCIPCFMNVVLPDKKLTLTRGFNDRS